MNESRFLKHRRFYIPALIALFLSHPGSLTLFSAFHLKRAVLADRVEWVTFLAISMGSFGWILISSLGFAAKITCACFLSIAFSVFSLLFVRNRFGGADLFDVFVDSLNFPYFLPLLILFAVLCALDRVKRSKVTIWILYGACFGFLIQNVRHFGEASVFDSMRLEDVERQIANQSYTSRELLNECQTILHEEKKLRCIASLSDALKAPLCENKVDEERDRCISQSNAPLTED